VAGEIVLGVTSDGLLLAEAELLDGDPSELVELARAAGAAVLWVHSNTDLAAAGFRREHGFVRLEGTPTELAGKPRVLLDGGDYAATLDAAYRGLWGHKQVGADATPPPDSSVLALYDGGRASGLCTVFPTGRLVDGPGVVPGARAPERYVALLRAACAALGAGPVEVVSWGDDPGTIDAYCALGLEVVERTGGWSVTVS
jgi:hypothetical protein